MFILHFHNLKNLIHGLSNKNITLKLQVLNFLKVSTSRVRSKIIKTFPKQRTGAQGLIKTLPPAFRSKLKLKPRHHGYDIPLTRRRTAKNTNQCRETGP